METSSIKEKIKGFFKKNYYYVIMSVCVIAIGVMITVAVVQSGKKPPIEEPPANNNTEDPGQNTGGNETVVFQMPIEGSTGTGLTYDESELQYSSTMHQWQAHYGIDYLAPANTAVSAVFGGIVESITTNELMGTTIVVLHDNGVRSIYACLSSEVNVLANQRVNKGQKLGVVAASGFLEADEGPHLHFELKADGKNIDPTTYFEANK